MSIKEFKKLKALTLRIGKETEILINKTQGITGGKFFAEPVVGSAFLHLMNFHVT